LIKSSTTPDFWSAYAELPPEVKARAKAVYRLWRNNPRHPSLRFKKTGTIWSIRIGGGYRALAIFEADTFYWFWIGAHDEYERLVGEM
jgi:hypothetical protein